MTVLTGARPVLGWKALEYAGLAAFTIIVPRLMGPERYGSFAGVLGAVGLLTLIAGIGASATLSRFVPEYVAQGRLDRVRQLFTQILVARAIIGLLLGTVLVVLLPSRLPEASAMLGVWAGATVLAGAVSLACFQLFYGLNRLDRWLVRDALIRPVLMVLLLVLGRVGVLDRAGLALFGAEALLLLLGLHWARSYLSRSGWADRFEGTREHLQFGLFFFAANLLLMAVWRGGEVTLLLLSTSPAEIGFFNIANAVAMAFGALLGQLAAMLIPALTTLHVTGDAPRADAWLGYSLKYLTIATIFFALILDGAGEWLVRLVLGPPYLRVVPNLQVLALGLIPLALVRTAVSQSIIGKRPWRAIQVGGAGVAGFAFGAAFLVPAYGSLGASLAVAAALGAAGLAAYLQFRSSEILAAARFWRVVLPGLPAVALTVVPGIPAPAAALGAVALYGILLSGTAAVTREELGRLAQSVRRT